MEFKNIAPHLTIKNIFGLTAILLIVLMVFFKDEFNLLLLISFQLFAVTSYFGLETLENIKAGAVKISYGQVAYCRDTQPKQFWLAVSVKSLLCVAAFAMFLFFLFFYIKSTVTS